MKFIKYTTKEEILNSVFTTPDGKYAIKVGDMKSDTHISYNLLHGNDPESRECDSSCLLKDVLNYMNNHKVVKVNQEKDVYEIY